MREMASRPRVFLSSTIYDFADLRSAVKFWLEEQGYEVDASECNDFSGPLDKNSYDACLEAIDRCDYFVLFIGARAGGWFDETTRVTITMREYRQAYERAKRGEVKLFVFVRRSIWDAREDRVGLRDLVAGSFAQERGLMMAEVQRIERHRSRIVQDADIVFDFLREVERRDEMKSAVDAQTPRPAANWVFRFEGFREVLDALRVRLGGARGLRRVALEANLRAELTANLGIGGQLNSRVKLWG